MSLEVGFGRRFVVCGSYFCRGEVGGRVRLVGWVVVCSILIFRRILV